MRWASGEIINLRRDEYTFLVLPFCGFHITKTQVKDYRRNSLINMEYRDADFRAESGRIPETRVSKSHLVISKDPPCNCNCFY